MKSLLHFFILFPLIIFSQDIELDILSKFSLNSISSASGIEKIDNKTFIVSDDQSYLFFTKNFNEINKINISTKSEGRINKLYKPDFEALGKLSVEDQEFLLILSSGSKINYRDTIFLYHPKTNKIVCKRNFRKIYDIMRQKAQLSKWALTNIEAVSTDNKYVYLFQRGNIDGRNVVFRFNKFDFFNYLLGKRNSLDFDFKKFKLPIEENTKAGFSGACFLNEDEMIFTASLETSPTAYTDGNILGSYIGILNYKTSELHYAILKKDNAILETKLESVCIIKKIRENKIMIFLSSDNDNGTSEFFEIVLTKNYGSD